MATKAPSHILLATSIILLIALFWVSYNDAAKRNRSDALQREGAVRAHAEALVASVSNGQEHVISSFVGPDGLMGVVVENADKQRDLAWLSPNATAVLVGGLLGTQGKDLTREAKIQHGLILSLEAVLKAASSPATHAFTDGSAGPLLTVFFDPNCVYCHQLYSELATASASGQVRVRYVMVGTLKSTSLPRAASLLGASDPAKALATNESHYDPESEEGGFPIAKNIDPELTATVTANNELFTKSGMVGTPTTLYCDKSGTPILSPGVPADISKFIHSAGTCM